MDEIKLKAFRTFLRHWTNYNEGMSADVYKDFKHQFAEKFNALIDGTDIPAIDTSHHFDKTDIQMAIKSIEMPFKLFTDAWGNPVLIGTVDPPVKGLNWRRLTLNMMDLEMSNDISGNISDIFDSMKLTCYDQIFKGEIPREIMIIVGSKPCSIYSAIDAMFERKGIAACFNNRDYLHSVVNQHLEKMTGSTYAILSDITNILLRIIRGLDPTGTIGKRMRVLDEFIPWQVINKELLRLKIPYQISETEDHLYVLNKVEIPEETETAGNSADQDKKNGGISNE